MELEIYSSKSSYYDWAKIRFTSQFRPKLSLKKKDPATIPVSYTHLDRFVASLDRGIYIDGNFVPIEIEGADWVDKDDSLLKAQVAVQVMITFNGGVYRDTGFAPLTDVRVTSVEKIT